MKKLVIAALMAACFQAQAAVFIAAGAAGAAAASSRAASTTSANNAQTASSRNLSICFWQVPGQLDYINLAYVYSVRSTVDRKGKPETEIYILNRANITLEGVAADHYIGLIQQRLRECAEGK